MKYRKRLLQGATVSLYMGPLLAGLAGFGPVLLLPFVAIFMLWLVLLRPHKWPRSFTELRQPPSVLAVFTLAITQILFVTLLFGVGRGIGGVLGYLPLFHPLLPVMLSLIALPALRLVWQPDLALAVEDETTAPETGRNAAEKLIGRPIAISAEGAVSELFALSEDGTMRDDHMLDALDRFFDTGDQWSRLAVLAAALDASPASAHGALRRAVIFKATDPIPQTQFTVPGEMRTAFAAAGNSAELLTLLALRARALLHKIPATAQYFPPRSVVMELAAASEDDPTARALRDLAAELPQAGGGDAAGIAASAAKPAVKTPVPVFGQPSARGFAPPTAGAQSA